MKKRAFTLIEMIISIVILGILSAGTFVSIKHLYLRVAKSKAMADLSLESQIIVDQISALLYDRIPISVVGYDENNNSISIYEIVDENLSVLEWWGVTSESLKRGYYSGFVDMDASDRDANLIKTYDINKTGIKTVLGNKFDNNDITNLALVFAGTFDNGVEKYNITSIDTDSITLETTPNEIYEKYYLADSAYAMARGEDIDFTCKDVGNRNDNNNTLYLFYNYRPWKSQTFCDGNVTILTKEAKGFEVGLINDSIYFNLTLEREIKGSENNVTLSKQKVVF